MISLKSSIAVFLIFLFMSTAAGNHASANGTIPNGTIPTFSNRILILGDSITHGAYATSYNKTFRYRLGEMLGMDVGGDGYYNLPTVAMMFPNYVSWKPDIIVVEVGINDILGFGPNLINDETQWKAAYLKLLQDMKATGARVVITTTFAIIRTDHPKLQEFERRNQMIRDIAIEIGVDLVDLWALTKGHEEYKSIRSEASALPPDFRGDGAHPNDLGHEVIARAIYDALTESVYLPFVAN